MRTLEVFQPLQRLGEVDLRAEPVRWLPEECRPAGPHRWRIPLRLGAFTRSAVCTIGSPVTKEGALWRRFAWSPDADVGDVLPLERLLPSFDGEIGLSFEPPTLLLHGGYDVPLGPVGEAIDELLLHRAARRTATRLLGEIAGRLGSGGGPALTGPPPPPEGERERTREPGAPRRTRPLALVVDEDPELCSVLAEDLRAKGYRVVTCLGPAAVNCRAARAGARSRGPCPRVPAETDLILLGARAGRTRLPEAYAAWLPTTEIRSAP